MSRLQHGFSSGWLYVLLTAILISCATEQKPPLVAQPSAYNELAAVEAFYGIAARQRVQSWRQLQENYQGQLLTSQLNAANDFFNQLVFEDDTVHWQTDEYWATPLETVATNGGDCEDFAIGKYFTLKALGIPAQCLRMTYVKAISLNKAHMVLSYQCQASDPTLILDNLITSVLAASERHDLVPVFSFNENGLWLSDPNTATQPISDAAHLSRWQSLLKRVDEPLKP